MHEIDIIDETFDRDRTTTYELSIQVSLNGFSYAVKDTVRNTFIALFNTDWKGYSIDCVNYRDFLNRLIEAKPWLTKEFKKIIVAFNLPYYTLIPADFFDPTNSKSILDQVHSIPECFELGHTELNNLLMVIVYAAPHEFINEWKRLHSKTLFIHSLKSFVHIPYNYSSKPYLQIDVDHQYVNIAIHSNGQLLVANSYTCKTPTDIVYYSNAISKAMFEDIDHIHVNLTGDGELMVGLPEEMGKYFNFVSHQAEFYKPVFFSYKLLRFRTEYFRLFNLGVTCE